MKLAQLQKEFADFIYQKDLRQNKILSQIKNYGVSPKARLQVYQDNVIGCFDDVLESFYPITKKIVGAEYFGYLSAKYHKKYRSRSGNLDDYGAYFGTLIGSLLKKHKLLYLKDMAKAEWSYHRAYFACDTKPFNIKRLQSLKEEEYCNVKFRLHPSCYLMASDYPIYTIWQEVEKESDKQIDINQCQGEFILIYRHDFQVKINRLTKAEYLFLKKIKQKLNIYHIYQDLAKESKDFDIGAFINKYITEKVLSSFTF